MSGMFFDVFLFIVTHIFLVPFSPGSTKANAEWGGNWTVQVRLSFKLWKISWGWFFWLLKTL